MLRRDFILSTLASLAAVVDLVEESGKGFHALENILDSGVEEIRRVSTFWREAARGNSIGKKVRIRGTLSRFSSHLLGSPAAACTMHRDLRHSLPKSGMEPHQANALLSLSAGQMVVGRDTSAANRDQVYLGFYHGIVRNSIPVLVNAPYYYESVDPLFKKFGPVIEVELTGVVTEFSKDVLQGIQAFPAYTMLKSLIDVNAASPPVSLTVAGSDDTTRISHAKEETRYLDGDIWVAIQSGSHEHLLTRFVDLSDPDELAEQREGLRKEAEKYVHKDSRIVEYDMNDRLFPKVSQG